MEEKPYQRLMLTEEAFTSSPYKEVVELPKLNRQIDHINRSLYKRVVSLVYVDRSNKQKPSMHVACIGVTTTTLFEEIFSPETFRNHVYSGLSIGSAAPMMVHHDIDKEQEELHARYHCLYQIDHLIREAPTLTPTEFGCMTQFIDHYVDLCILHSGLQETFHYALVVDMESYEPLPIAFLPVREEEVTPRIKSPVMGYQVGGYFPSMGYQQ